MGDSLPYQRGESKVVIIYSGAAAGTLAKNGGATHASPPTESTCDVVVERSDGSRLRLRLPVNWSHIEALCAHFLGRV